MHFYLHPFFALSKAKHVHLSALNTKRWNWKIYRSKQLPRENSRSLCTWWTAVQFSVRITVLHISSQTLLHFVLGDLVNSTTAWDVLYNTDMWTWMKSHDCEHIMSGWFPPLSLSPLLFHSITTSGAINFSAVWRSSVNSQKPMIYICLLLQLLTTSEEIPMLQ